MAVISATSLLVGSAILGGMGMAAGAVQQRNMRRQQQEALRKAEEDAKIAAQNNAAIGEADNSVADVSLGRRKGASRPVNTAKMASGGSSPTNAVSTNVGGLGTASQRLGI